MTTIEQKARERRTAQDFLATWPEGADWRLVNEPDAEERPDLMFVRSDGSEAVGVEMTRAVLEDLAESKAMSKRVAAEIEKVLRDAGVDRLGVLLFFAGGSAGGFRGKDQAAKVGRVAKLVLDRLPVSSSVTISDRTLDRLGVYGVSSIQILEADELAVVDAGGHAHGPGIGVLQPFIDRKLDELPAYRVNAPARASRLVPPPAFGGVWLIVSIFDGPGFSSSISTHGAERDLSRRDFDRVFLLDYFAGDRGLPIEITRNQI